MRTARESTEYGPEQTHAPLLPAKPACPRADAGDSNGPVRKPFPLLNMH